MSFQTYRQHMSPPALASLSHLFQDGQRKGSSHWRVFVAGCDCQNNGFSTFAGCSNENADSKCVCVFCCKCLYKSKPRICFCLSSTFIQIELREAPLSTLRILFLQIFCFRAKPPNINRFRIEVVLELQARRDLCFPPVCCLPPCIGKDLAPTHMFPPFKCYSLVHHSRPSFCQRIIVHLSLSNCQDDIPNQKNHTNLKTTQVPQPEDQTEPDSLIQKTSGQSLSRNSQSASTRIAKQPVHSGNSIISSLVV